MVARRSDNTTAAPGAEGSLKSALVERNLEIQRLEQRVRELEESGGRFLSDATHAVRTPLTVILSYLEILQADLTPDLSDEQLSFLGAVWDNAVKMRNLIDDLVELAALETKTAQLDPTSSDLAVLLIEVLAEFKPAFDRAGLEVTIDIDPGISAIRVDEAGMRIVIRRLVENAVQFTPAGQEIIVRAYQKKRNAVIEIIDTGAGIPEDRIADAFREFVQLHRKPGRPRSGYGLGLPIARRLVEAFGGSLTAESKDGEGSTFRVLLPVESTKS